MTVSTSATSSAGPGTVTQSGHGDIAVGSNIAWSSNNALTISAYRNITVNAGVTLTNTGAGNLTLRADNTGIDTGAVALNGNINYSGSTGNVAILYNPPSGYNSAVTYSNVSTNGSWTAPTDKTVSSQFTAYMLVNNVTDLANVANNPAGTFGLGTNIDASSVSNFTPIGGSFSGIFDGQGHSISNLTISNAGSSVGLFGSSTGSIRNVSLLNESVTAASAQYAGGLVGSNSGPISTSYVQGTVTGGSSGNAANGQDLGGLVGRANSPSAFVINSGANVNVSGPVSSSNQAFGWYFGGLIGFNYGNISNSYAAGNVSYTGSLGSNSSNYRLGGLAGYAGNYQNQDSVTNCFATGTVPSGSSIQSGALFGYDGNISATNLYYLTGGQSATGAGTGCSCIGFGLSAFQNGTLPNGFSSSVWDALSGYNPYLNWQYTPVSGQVSNYGGSAIASAGVSALVGGSVVSSATSSNSGNFSLLIPSSALNGGGGFLAYLTSGGTGNAYFEAASSFTLYANYLTLNSTSTPNYSALVSRFGAALGSNSGANFLASVSNGTLSLSSNANLLVASVTPQFVIDQAISGNQNVLLGAMGNLTLNNGVSISARGAGSPLTLFTEGSFTNNAGANALSVSGGGRWLLYSQTPSNDTLGGLNYGFKQYNASYGSTIPAQITGNGLLYALAPTITSTLTGTTGKTYDSTTAATLTSANWQNSGAISGDIVSITDTSATYADKDAGVGKAVTATGLTLSAVNGLAPVYGYQLASTSATANIGTITLAPLTAAVTGTNKTYDSLTTDAGSVVLNASGILGSDLVSLQGSGTYTFANPNAGNSKTVTATGVSLTGAAAGNYSLTLVNGSANITPASLLYVATGTTRPYAGDNPTLTGTVTGFAGSDTLSSATTGSALFSTQATLQNNAGSYAITGSGLSATNYTLSQAAGNATALTVAPITVSIGNVTRSADQPNPPFTASYSGRATTYLQTVLSNLTLVTNAPASNAPGTYQITAVVPSNPGLAADLTVVPGTLTITAATTSPIPTPIPTPTPTPIPTPGPLVPVVPPTPTVLPASLQTELPVLPNLLSITSGFQLVMPAQDWSGVLAPSGQTTAPPLAHSSFADSSPNDSTNRNPVRKKK